MRSLKQPNVLPPKGFSYTQPETGMTFDGNTLLPRQIKNVLSHRTANRLGRATEREVYDDILAAVCGRFPGLCIEIPDPPPVPTEPAIILPKKQDTKVAASKKTKLPPPIEFVAPRIIAKSEMKPVVRKTRKCGACGGRKKL